MIKLTAVTDTVYVRANLGDMQVFTCKEIRPILLPGKPNDRCGPMRERERLHKAGILTARVTRRTIRPTRTGRSMRSCWVSCARPLVSTSKSRNMWLIGTPLDNALAVLALGVFFLLLASVAYGRAE